MRNTIILTVLLLSFFSCRPDLDYEIHGYTQKIIVEGNISDGRYAKVYLSLNFPLSQRVDSTNYQKFIISRAKVTVSDGQYTEVLTGGLYDSKNFPYFWYSGNSLKGKAGKTYYLTVEYGGYTFFAQTTIPYPNPIQKITSMQVTSRPTMRSLSLNVFVDPSRKCSFRIESMKLMDGYFIQTPFLYNSEFTLTGNTDLLVSPQPLERDKSYDEGSYFATGDTVLIQISTIDSIATQFFKGLSSFGSSGSSLFIGEKDALKSNISSPGFGIWYGSSKQDTTIIVH